MRTAFTYKQKKWAIILLMMVITIIVYKNNIKRTISLYKEYTLMEEQIEANLDLPVYVKSLERKLMAQSLSDSVQVQPDEVTQSVLLDYISKACSRFNIKLVRFGDPISYRQKAYNVELNLITLEGNFKQLTQCIYWIETSNALKGNIMSIDYKLHKKFGGKGDKLLVTVYLQRVKIETNEK